jgi:predicted DNA-binding protein with PD1-like motif
VIVAESRRGRRLVGRLDRGVELLEGLAEVGRAHAVRTAEVRAFGSLEQVVLSEFDQRSRAYRPARRFDAQFEILQLSGNLSEREGKAFVHANISLSRERDNGIELIGGHLVSGRVFAVEFVFDVFDDLLLRRVPDPQTGLALWSEVVRLDEPEGPEGTEEPEETAAPALPFEAPARTSWSDVVAASAASAASPASEDKARAPVAVSEPLPEVSAVEVHVAPGDWIDHPKFGRCQVERVEGDYEFVSARLRNQRLIRLSLDVITLVPAGREGDKQLFRAVPGR